MLTSLSRFVPSHEWYVIWMRNTCDHTAILFYYSNVRLWSVSAQQYSQQKSAFIFLPSLSPWAVLHRKSIRYNPALFRKVDFDLLWALFRGMDGPKLPGQERVNIPIVLSSFWDIFFKKNCKKNIEGSNVFLNLPPSRLISKTFFKPSFQSV